MERLVRVAKLRLEHSIGYIHEKSIPGASGELMRKPDYTPIG
jgi:predicted DNA-binding helix-hairpin-helix protein